MKKKTPTFIVTVWLLLLFVALTPMLTVKSANADNLAFQWGHLNYETVDYDEKDAEEEICDLIFDNFDENTTFGIMNNYWTYTTASVVQQVLNYVESPYSSPYVDWATHFWVGDFVPEGAFPINHRGFFGHNNYTIWDNEVYVYANYHYWPPPYNWWEYIGSKNYFEFIWTCANGGLLFNSAGFSSNVTGITWPDPNDEENEPTYTPQNNFTDYGHIPSGNPPFDTKGMPAAFTGTTDMSTDGYDDPDYGSYCYIGWENPSPFMIDVTDGDVQYKWFPLYFYDELLGEGESIIASLDMAANLVYGETYDFADTELYNGYWVYKDEIGEDMDGWWYTRMRVFGNGNIVLP
jgi:hypothetical protein